ncbi:hypothetical protein C5167_043628 [Papaver somniferum]|uniref:Uncharacterized protein n=1 Tax=Papaver somniferum TaxID=3469 RepID=A0A4Y7L673_PAPSO|nr:hypothetical protein C5167_043628 [Papaver somniferum]
MVKGKMNPPRKDDTITGNLRQSLNAVKDLVKVIKPIGLTDRAQRYLRRAAYGELVMMYYDDYDTTVPTTTRQITTNKHRVLKLLNCFDMDCETPCSFRFADDKIIESTPAKLAGIFCMQRIGSRKGQKLLKYYCPSDLTDNVLYSKYFTDIKSTKHQTTVTKTNILEKIKQLMAKRRKSGKRKKVDEKDLVCLIGLYLCCVLFFGDKNANGVNAKYLSIVETYDTVLKVSWPDLIHEHLFEEIHTNLSCLSNVKACVQYLLPTPSFVAEFSQLEKQLGISTVVPSKDDLQSWLKAQTIENSHLKEQLQEKQAMLKAVYAIAREGISEGDLSGTAEFKVHKFSCQIIQAMGIDPYKVTQEEFMQHEDDVHGDGSTEQEKEKDDAETSFNEEFPCMSLAAGNTPTILQAQTAAEGHKRPLRTYSSSMKSVTTCKTPPKKKPVAKQKPTPTNNVDEEQKKDVEETPVTDEAQKKAADGGVVDGAGDDVAAKVNEDTPGTFDDSSASTQFEDSMVITATTPQTQPDNAQTYSLVQLGANPDDMTNVEVSEMIDEIVSNINKTEHGPAVTENAEPTSTATTQENVFSLGLEKTPKPAGELLKEAANTIRERQPSLIQQRVLRNRKIPTQDLKQYQRNSKRIKKKANEEEMAAVPEVEEDRMAEVAEEDDGTMRNDVKGSEVIERLEGEKKNKVLEYFNTHPKTDIAWIECDEDGNQMFDISGELMLQLTKKESYLESEFIDFYISRLKTKMNSNSKYDKAIFLSPKAYISYLKDYEEFKKFWIPKLAKEYVKYKNDAVRLFAPMCNNNTTHTAGELKGEHLLQAKKYAFAITTELRLRCPFALGMNENAKNLNAPPQGTIPDCLPCVCNYMKIRMKNKPLDKKLTSTMMLWWTDKLNRMRGSMLYKILSDPSRDV